MEEPTYHLAGVMHTRDELPADFDGPLSVILLLLSKNKIEIQDVSITSILEQYLAYLDEMKRLDMEIASEFIAMASHLMLIKTKMLLSAAEREEAMSEMEQLIASLEEHQRHENFARIKAVIPELSDRYAIGRDYIAKVPEPIPADKSYRYVHQKDDLLRAMTAVLERVDHKMPPPMAAFEGIVGREPYPVADKAGEILRRLVQFGVTRFRTLFQGNRSRSEIVATFIAVLELCRARRLRLAGKASD